MTTRVQKHAYICDLVQRRNACPLGMVSAETMLERNCARVTLLGSELDRFRETGRFTCRILERPERSTQREMWSGSGVSGAALAPSRGLHNTTPSGPGFLFERRASNLRNAAAAYSRNRPPTHGKLK